jgi:hypothetical protein
MQPSDAEQAEKDNGQSLASIAEALYLMNLLLFPGLAFLVLLYLYYKYRNSAPPLARCHLRQTVSASIWAGIMIGIINVLIIVLGGYDSATTWIVGILYFVSIHALMVFLGALGLAKAMAGQHYHYLFFGTACSDNDKLINLNSG